MPASDSASETTVDLRSRTQTIDRRYNDASDVVIADDVAGADDHAGFRCVTLRTARSLTAEEVAFAIARPRWSIPVHWA